METVVFRTGDSVTPGIVFDAAYDTNRIEDLQLVLGSITIGSLADMERIGDAYVIKMPSSQTADYLGTYNITVVLTDRLLGVKQFQADKTITFSETGSGVASTATDSGVSFLVVVNPLVEITTSDTYPYEFFKGGKGDPATIAVGTVTTGDPGTDVEVTDSGTPGAAVLNFTIPRGADGQEVELTNDETYIKWRYVGGTTWTNLVALSALIGPAGPAIEVQVDGGYIQWRVVGADTWTNLIAVSTLKGDQGTTYYTYVAYASDATGTGFSLTPSDGLKYMALRITTTAIPAPQASDFAGLWVKYIGDDGDAATVSVGTVTTLDPDEDATVENVGTSLAAVFDFGIPKGEKGDPGGSTLNTPPTVVAMAAYEIDMEAGEVFTKTCGADSAFTIANLILWKPITMVLTGGSLATTMFTGYTEHWLVGSEKADYDDEGINYLRCQVRSEGHIYLFFETLTV